MKKINLIFIITITLLALLSTNVLAVDREQFQIAITQYVKDMKGYNKRFLQASNNKDDRTIISYNNRTVMSTEINDTAMFFTDDTFVSYVYKEVLGLEMISNDTIYADTDIYNNLYSPTKTNCKYFKNAFSGEISVYDENTKNRVNADLMPGDVLVERWWHGGTDIAYIYLGNGEFAYFKDGNVSITDVYVIKNKKFDVARVSESTLNSKSTLKNKFNINAIKTDATTIQDALNNLNLTVTLKNNSEIEFYDTVKKEVVTPVQIAKAVREGVISQYGSIDKLDGDIYLTLDYKDNAGNMVIMGSNNSSEITTNIRKSETSTNNKKFGDYHRYLDIEEYVDMGYIYWGRDYLYQKDHSLYLGICIDIKGSLGKTRVYTIPISNGAEQTNGSNEKYIECFSQIVEEKEDGTKPTLQEFLDISLEPPPETYKLTFAGVGDKEKIRNDSTTAYKTNSEDEILFTVDRDGTYVITPTVKTSQNDYGKIETFPIFIGVPNMFNPGEIISNPHDRISILNAGVKTEGLCKGKICKDKKYENGDYYSKDPMLTYPLKSGVIYVLNVKDMIQFTTDNETRDIDNWEFEFEYLNNKLAELFSHDLLNWKSQNIEQFHINGENDEEFSLFVFFERLLAYPVRNTANLLIIMTNSQAGYIDADAPQMTVSIDTIIFDHYPLTKLSLFAKDVQADDSKNFVNDFLSVINTWYRNFMLIAIVAYLAILLYMGIRIVLNSTAANKAMYKELFAHWVAGVVILFTFPTVIRYAIKINSAFVEMIESVMIDELGLVNDVDSSVIIGEYTAPDDTSEIYDENNRTQEVSDLIKNPFDENDTGYMAIMARRAHNTQRLSYAFVYLIMAFQLMIILIMYYKRLFMVVFLIVLFPLVMIAHLLEKVADIKTGGAFGKWTKEIFINIFVQSIHAIIYSFALSTVMSAGNIDGTNAQNDWILMLVGVTFLFTGEEILKKILGQSSESAPALGKTATKTIAAVTAVTAGSKRIADNVIGSNSHLGRAITNYREGRVLKKKSKLVDEIGTKPKEYRMPPASQLDHFRPEYTDLGDNQALEIGNAIQIMNHIELATPEQISYAMSILPEAKASGKYKDLLQDLNMNDNQLAAFQLARDKVATDAVSGTKTKQQIDMELTMTVEQFFHEANPQVMKAAIYMQAGSALTRNAVKDKDTTEAGIRKEIEEARERLADLQARIRIASDKVKRNTSADEELEANATKLLQDLYGIDRKFTADQYRMALSIAMIKNASSGKYDAKELMTSANFAFRHQNDSVEFARMAAAAGCNIEDFRHVLAEEISRRAYSRNYRTMTDRKAAKKFNGKARSRLDDARKMADCVLEEYEGKNAEPQSDSQRVTVAQVMQQEFKLEALRTEEDKAAQERIFEHEIQTQRQKTNAENQRILTEFTNEMIEATDVYKNKIEGMTAEDMRGLAANKYTQARREAGTAILTTAYSGLAAPIGAGLAIGLGDENGIITEAFAGGLAGAVAADTIVEAGMGDHIKRKVRMRNPYTGEMEEIEVYMIGSHADAGLTLTSSDISADLANKIKAQFLQNKIKQDRYYEERKEQKLQQERAQKRLEDTYRRLMRGDNNSEENTNT